MKVTWRQLPTVLFEDEVLDKAFSRARKAADRVDDYNRVFRTRKQLTRMIQTAADIIDTLFRETVQTWPSLDHSPQFDLAIDSVKDLSKDLAIDLAQDPAKDFAKDLATDVTKD